MITAAQEKHISIAALKAGDTEAFKQLVEEYKDAVVNICYGYVQQREDAEDLAQDVFVEVFRSMDKFREDSSIYTWVYRIATSKCLDALRSRKRVKRQAFFKARQSSGEEAPELDRIRGGFADPEQDLVQKQQQEYIADALDKLPEAQRIAFTLSNYQGMNNKDIAEIMERSAGSVESLIHRAKQNLRKHLYEFYKSQFG